MQAAQKGVHPLVWPADFAKYGTFLFGVASPADGSYTVHRSLRGTSPQEASMASHVSISTSTALYLTVTRASDVSHPSSIWTAFSVPLRPIAAQVPPIQHACPLLSIAAHPIAFPAERYTSSPPFQESSPLIARGSFTVPLSYCPHPRHQPCPTERCPPSHPASLPPQEAPYKLSLSESRRIPVAVPRMRTAF